MPSRIASGHRSPRIYTAVARELVAGLVQERPDLAKFPEEVAAWAEAEARAALLRRYIAREGIEDAHTGELRATALKEIRAAERAAREARKELGLTPRSEASLARDRAAAQFVATDLGALAAAGRAALAAGGTLPEPSAIEDAEVIDEPDDPTGTVLARVQAEADAQRRAFAAANGYTIAPPEIAAEKQAARRAASAERRAARAAAKAGTAAQAGEDRAVRDGEGRDA